MRINNARRFLHITQSYKARKTPSFSGLSGLTIVAARFDSAPEGNGLEFFPAFLKLEARDVLLVGGGPIAVRKARLLLDAGARLTVVAPEFAEFFVDAEDRGRLETVRREFREADLAGKWLVVSATGHADVERFVARAADRERVFCNAVDDIENCSYITPAIVDRDPVIVAVSSAGTAPVLARRIRRQLESTLPARLGRLARIAGRWRQRVTQQIGELSARVRFWEAFFDGPAMGAVASGNESAVDGIIESLLKSSGTGGVGEAMLVGAGPGDPDLITLAAFNCLQSADVILHDRLVSDDVLSLARRDADFISVGKSPGCIANRQEEINALLVQLVSEGKRVCRLKGGDPFVFGRGGEEADALAEAGLPFRIVPGITAAAGCAAAAGIPLTHRDDAQSVVLITGHGRDSVDNLDWPSLARDRQTLAVYMGVRRFGEIMQNLVEHGRSADTPIGIVERGTTPQQRVLRGTLGQLPMLARAHRVESPAILIIGDVAKRGRNFQPALDVSRGDSDELPAISTNL